LLRRPAVFSFAMPHIDTISEDDAISIAVQVIAYFNYINRVAEADLS
jgi:hypothetical protein